MCERRKDNIGESATEGRESANNKDCKGRNKEDNG